MPPPEPHDQFLEGRSADERELISALRATIRAEAPGLAEAIRFGALSFFHPDAHYGSIGGNVCMIECRDGAVRLSFIHGADLADPHAVLRGNAKAKRYVEISSLRAARAPALRELVRDSAARPMP